MERNRNGGDVMDREQTVELFSAGCPLCTNISELIERLICNSCDLVVLDTHNPEVAKRAAMLGIHSLPALVIDGQPADCCRGNGINEENLRLALAGKIK